MKILIEKLKPLGFNEREMTEADFHSICERENIAVRWSDRKFSFYFSAFGEACITLPKRLTGLRFLFAAYHELGHHFAHVGDEPFVAWHGMPYERDEFEADAIALIALMPLNSTWTDILDGSRFARSKYDERLRLYFLFGV